MNRSPVHAYQPSKSVIKIQIICLLALILALPAGVWAKPTTPEQARTVVENWLALDATPLGVPLVQQVKEIGTYTTVQGGSSGENAPGSKAEPAASPLVASPGTLIKEVRTYFHQDTPVYYVVYLNPAGFVIVPADDLVEPIIGFLPAGQYNPSADNPLGAMVSQDLPGRVLDARQKEKQVQTEGLQLAPTEVYVAAQRKWGWLSNPAATGENLEFALPTPPSDERVPPLSGSTWDQSLVGGSACYNYYTPPNAAGSASNYVSGCVATAMAQFMRFWHHPTIGVGTGSYTIYINSSSTTRSLRGGDGLGGAYLWGDMPWVPSSSMTDAQRQAIGALIADAGVSVNMNYTNTSSGSGTDTSYASYALVHAFHYSNAKSAWSGDNTISIPITNRNNMVNPNLDAGYPTLLGIRGSVGGHAIVCDGYGYNSSTLYHHLNMGWSGSDNAWYNLPTIDTSWTTFNVQYKVIYNVYKEGSGEIISGRITGPGGVPLSGVTITATGPGGPYTVTTNAKGIYALPKVASSATYSLTASKPGFTFASNPRSVTTGTSISTTSPPSTPGGVPNVSPSTTTGNKWGINFVSTRSDNVLYDNGAFINSPETGAGGAGESVVQTSRAMTTYGFTDNGDFRLADDFTLTSRSRISKIKFYAYQTNSPTTSTITAVNLRIWNGPPNNPGSSVIYGDTTNNRMTSTGWTKSYRVLESTPGDTNRPIMVVTAGLGVTLNPGTYWLDWQMAGSASYSGPYALPVTRNGQTTTGNALQYQGSSWGAVNDSGSGTQQGFPFIVETGGVDISPILMLLLN
jgi:hypothetical protein